MSVRQRAGEESTKERERIVLKGGTVFIVVYDKPYFQQ